MNENSQKMAIMSVTVIGIGGSAALVSLYPNSQMSFLGKMIMVALMYVFTLATSGIVFDHFVGELDTTDDDEVKEHRNTPTGYTTGVIIGKCENILILTLMLLGGYTGLAVVFAAKPIARADEFKQHPEYYLAGTLLNFSYSVCMGGVLRILLKI